MIHSYLLGAAYGIGGTAFGISIRYIGFSLTYAIAVGLSSVLGTLIPPLVRGTLVETLSQPGSTGSSWASSSARSASPPRLGRPTEGSDPPSSNAAGSSH